jgi:hypothetical protein
MIYYRVALQDKQTPTWKWQSTVLTSLDALLLFLRTYKSFPREDVRVFFSSSTEGIEEMLSRQNQGLVSSSVSADQLLTGKSMNSSEIKRLEFELTGAGDHDEPYTFALPTYMPQLLAWMKLQARVRNGELES